MGVTAYHGRTEQVKGGGGAQAHPQARGKFRASTNHCLTLLEEILTVFCKEGNGLRHLINSRGEMFLSMAAETAQRLKSTGYSCEGQELSP